MVSSRFLSALAWVRVNAGRCARFQGGFPANAQAGSFARFWPVWSVRFDGSYSLSVVFRPFPWPEY